LPPLTELCGATCPLRVAELMFKLARRQLAEGYHPGLGAKALPGPLGYLPFRQGGFPTWWRHLRAPRNVLGQHGHGQPQLLLHSMPLLHLALCKRKSPACKLWKGACEVMVKPQAQFSQEISLCSAHRRHSPQRCHEGGPPRAAELALSRARTPRAALAAGWLQPARRPGSHPATMQPSAPASHRGGPRPSPRSATSGWCFPQNRGPERAVDNGLTPFSFCSWLHNLNRAGERCGDNERKFISEQIWQSQERRVENLPG